ncbi:hypothetical protein ACSBR1_037872 [Camellia fascicularis]
MALFPKKIVQGAAEGQIRESSQSAFSDPPHKQDLAIAALTKSYFVETQDTSTVTIKAKYGEYFIKFQLPVLSGMVKFQQEVTKRLNWMVGTYNVKYQDDDNDWISVSCDEDLRDTQAGLELPSVHVLDSVCPCIQSNKPLIAI